MNRLGRDTLAAPSGLLCASGGLIEWPDWRVWVDNALGFDG
jgi:hypothetical protein